MKENLFDVAIIGYGPVGATLANLLGQDGWRVALIEASAEIFPIPRAVHIDDEAQRIFQAAGVIGLIEPSFGGYPPDRQYINARGKVFFETHLSPNKPVGYQSNLYFHQPTLEAGLRAGIERFPHVETYLSTSASSISQDEDSVTIHAQNGESGATTTIQARYAIGCDGARSMVRKSLGIQLTDLNFEQPWLVTDFYLKPGLTREDVGFPYAHQQFCDPKQPISFIPNGVNNHYRFEFMLPADMTKEEAEQDAYVHKTLAQVVNLDQINLVRAAVYTFHSLIAERWRERRIFIAGDAAHQMPPFAGQGMCSGLRDVHNLSWKLGLVLNGSADDALLDSYESERKPHVTRMTKGTMFLGNLVQTQNPIRAWIRDLLFQTIFKIPAIFGRIAQYALRPPPLQTKLRGGKLGDLVGTYFIQPVVKDEAGNILLLDQLLGPNFAILGVGHDPAAHIHPVDQSLPLRAAQIVQRRDKSAKAEKPTPIAQTLQIEDHTGTLTAWFAEKKIDFILLRPDRFVFGAYTVDNISTAVAELSTHLNLRHKIRD